MMMQSHQVQLPLGVHLRPGVSFGNYHAGLNAEVVHALRHIHEASNRVVYLWSGEGAGKTHLLQAACHETANAGRTSVYVPLMQAGEFSSEMLEGLEDFSLVCLDDIQNIAGDAAWEAAVFHLYNRLRDHQSCLVMAADASPADVSLHLPDLRSRLAWGLVFQLQMLDDAGKVQALQLQARSRGLELTEDVAWYLLRRYPRDMMALFTLLERLDRASLSAQRRLTVPFVKSVLGGEE
jgi:DnaA family protein